jgi:Uma2 family endonuclease
MSVQELEKSVAVLPETIQPENDEPEYYYELYPTREDLMSESVAQSQLIYYLLSVLFWYYQQEGWLIVDDLKIFRASRRYKSYPVAPDIAVFKGVVLTAAQKRRLKSWKMILPHRPAPNVVFEIASGGTWKEDLEDKPRKYQRLGVKEYFAYDPNDPMLWKGTAYRLRGWRYSGRKMIELEPDERGWLWSEELESWLVPDEAYLRLYDRNGQLRLTEKEAEQAAKEKAWAKLRELGINPEDL